IFPPWRPTDDTDQTAVLAWSLIQCGGLDEEHLFYALRKLVFDHRSLLWDGKAVGAGGTTREILRPKTWDGSRTLMITQPIPSNGSLMRASALALYFGRYERVRPAIVRRMSEVTH